MRDLARSAGLSEKTQWSFQYGAVPKAMCLVRNPDGSFSFDEENGEGFILHIEEVGLAEPQIINALLQLRGKRGRIADFIQLWENGGRKIKAGPKFWVVFSTNPPEEGYSGRNEIDPALARGVVFKRMGEISEDSYFLAAEYFFTYKMGEKPKEKPTECILDIYNYPEIGKQISQVVAAFHIHFSKVLKKGEKGRGQKIPLTFSDMARVADGLIYMQIEDENSGFVDLTETLKYLLEVYYINRLADEDLKEEMRIVLEELLEGNSGKVEFEGEILTRKEVFDILVRRASQIGEQEGTKGDKEKFKDREVAQRRNNLRDIVDSLLGDPAIPEEVREILKS